MMYDDDETVDTGARSVRRDHESRAGGVALALVAGAAIGAAVALMMTPRTGPEMRSVLRKRASSLRDRAEGLLDETADDVGREVRRRSRQIRRTLDRMA
jgi:gas vesicle protein